MVGKVTVPRPVGPPWLHLPPLLADELFCVAHHERTGRPRIHPRVLGLGLAAGLLGELILCGRVSVTDGGDVLVINHDRLPGVLADSTLSVLAAQPQHRAVRTWLAFLSEGAVDSVAQRLAATGAWQRRQRRRFGLVQVSYRPADANAVFWRAGRLARTLASPQPIQPPDAVLAGLVVATGLADAALWDPDTRAACVSRIAAEVRRLPSSLCRLVAHTEAAVGDAVLAPR